MKKDLLAAEEACNEESLKPRRALSIVQSLRRHEETLRTANSHGFVGSHSAPKQTHALESAKGAPLSQPRATPWVTKAGNGTEG